MKLKSKKSDIFIPDGTIIEEALTRTTHLAIATHQDDAEIFAYHGISECFGRSDKWFSAVIVSNGAGSPRAGIYKDFTDEKMCEIRKTEQKKAAIIGEYSVLVQLAYSSTSVKDSKNEDVVSDIETILYETRPEVVYLHNPADKHDSHVAVFLRSLKALRRLPESLKPLKVYGCEVWRDLDWLSDNEKIALNVSNYKNVASSLVGVFDSQVSGGKRYDLATTGRRLANATFFASHATDETDALTYAMDITPLVKSPELSVVDYISEKIDDFKKDVVGKLKSYS